jgi:hypothetical protein
MQEDRISIICPFHDDTNPSLVIYVKDKRYYCFGCGARGEVTLEEIAARVISSTPKNVQTALNKVVPLTDLINAHNHNGSIELLARGTLALTAIRHKFGIHTMESYAKLFDTRYLLKDSAGLIVVISQMETLLK